VDAQSLTTGAQIAIGYVDAQSLTTGAHSTAIGVNAGYTLPPPAPDVECLLCGQRFPPNTGPCGCGTRGRTHS
jgi:hypothetical protein